MDQCCFIAYGSGQQYCLDRAESLSSLGLQTGEILTSEKEGMFSYRFERVECGKGERYGYAATVLNVIDADTLLLRVDLGFDSFVDERVRLRGVDAPELNDDDGVAARQFVTQRIGPGSPVRVFTYGCDRYGRYLADVFYSTGKLARTPSVESGCF